MCDIILLINQEIHDMNGKHKVFNLIILDESGSMSSIKGFIISGFNELVQTIKGMAYEFPDQEHFISFISFNGLAIKAHLELEPVALLKQIDAGNYNPNSNTPLYDAMASAINKLRKTSDLLENYNVLVTILTDGEENASKEFNQSDINKLVGELKEKNWTFTYIGTDHDVRNFARSLSIENSFLFAKSKEGIEKMFDIERNSRMKYMQKVRDNETNSEDFKYFEDDESKG